MESSPLISRRRLLASLPCLPSAGRLLAQQQSPTFSTGVKVVNVLAIVRDKKSGGVVTTLAKDDFVLDEDGRPQTIRYFTRESNLPLTLGLLIDTSGSTRTVLPDERSAAFRFLRQVMREDMDRAFVIHFDFEAELLQDLTSSKKQLEQALDQMDSPGLQRRYQGDSGGGRQFQRGRFPGGGYPGGRGRGRTGGRRGGTVLYDAIYLAANEIMRKQTGRKAMILLSDGVDNGSKETLSNAIEAAQRSDSLVYSILFEDPDMGGVPFPGMGGRRGYGETDGKKIMQQISRETGGRFFEVSKRMPLDKVFATVEEEIRSQYSIGYTPDSTDSAAYRHIHLATKQKNYVVQTREGYYSS